MLLENGTFCFSACFFGRPCGRKPASTFLQTGGNLRTELLPLGDEFPINSPTSTSRQPAKIKDGRCTSSGRDQGERMGRPTVLYKYNGNLLQLCTFSVCGLSLAAQISAGGKFLSARGNEKSAGGYSLHQQVEQAVERPKKEFVTLFALRACLTTL